MNVETQALMGMCVQLDQPIHKNHGTWPMCIMCVDLSTPLDSYRESC